MKTLPANVIKLIETYKASQLRLIDMIAKAEAKGNVTAYRRAVLADVKQELSSLDKFARKWVSKEIPLSYKEGMNKTLDAIKKTDIDITKVMTSKKAIKTLTDSASGMLEEASMYVGRRINDLLKEAGEEAIAEKLSAGDTVKQAKSLMLKKMSDKGITAIRDKRGREISLDAYASMVARTTTREATNTGTIDAVQEVGGDLVQMTSHASACPICQPLEGRVYSISGKSKKYPKLDIAFSNGHPVIHPNCIHSIVPFFEQFADDLDEIVKQSNRPFEPDPKKKSQLDAYYADQKKKAQRRSDYKLWEKSKTLAPDDAPKTFSGFRSMKRADSERYQQLRMKMDKVLKEAQTVKNDPIKEAVEAITQAWKKDSTTSFGIRGDNIDIKVGQKLDASYGWDYDNDIPSTEKLDGTSAVPLGQLWFDGEKEDEEEVLKAYNHIMKNYDYKNVSVVGGEFTGYGNDEKEAIIKNAVVLFIF